MEIEIGEEKDVHRDVRISVRDMTKIRVMYENIMSYASHGLFVREGEIIGAGIAEEAMLSGKENYFERVGGILKQRGWVGEIVFGEDEVVVYGSAEAFYPTGRLECVCHRLRGIIAAIYSKYMGLRVSCHEVDCASINGEKCVFKIEVK